MVSNFGGGRVGAAYGVFVERWHKALHNQHWFTWQQRLEESGAYLRWYVMGDGTMRSNDKYWLGCHFLLGGWSCILIGRTWSFISRHHKIPTLIKNTNRDTPIFSLPTIIGWQTKPNVAMIPPWHVDLLIVDLHTAIHSTLPIQTTLATTLKIQSAASPNIQHMYPHWDITYHRSPQICSTLLQSPPEYAHIKRRRTPLKENQPQEKYGNIQQL